VQKQKFQKIKWPNVIYFRMKKKHPSIFSKFKVDKKEEISLLNFELKKIRNGLFQASSFNSAETKLLKDKMSIYCLF